LFRDKFIFGLKLSIINQCFQILGINLRSLYLYIMLQEWSCLLPLTQQMGLKYYLGSEATISFHNEEKPLFLGVNLVAWILFGIIIKLRDTIKQEKATFSELEISDGSELQKLSYKE
jgi:hypothetical protein